MVVEISKKRIIELEKADVLAELSIVKDRLRRLGQKYQSDFDQFKDRVDNLEEEQFKLYDDLLAWEGYLASKNHLEKRLEDLKHAKNIVVTE